MLQGESTRSNSYRALGESSMGGENQPRAGKEGAAAISISTVSKRTGPDDYRPLTEAVHQLGAAHTKDIKGVDQGKGGARTARMIVQKKKYLKKIGLSQGIDHGGVDRKDLVKDLENVVPKQRDSPKNQRGKIDSIKGRAEPGRRCCQENRGSLQSKNGQRTEAAGQGESSGKYS